MENKRKKDSEKNGGSGMAGNGSRWQPTKEQIDILESVYSAGVKTPTAEQIQQITARLSVYGHIEGKNVFYWFQNTKARRRQKQKQDRLALLTRFCHHSPPPPPLHFPFPSPPPIIPNGETGFYYYHYDQVQASGPVMEARRWIPSESRERKVECKATLELFPLQPGAGGDLCGSNSNISDEMNDEYSPSKDGEGEGKGGFIDFFSGGKFTSDATETES